jgi:hypothetical protein
MNGNGVIDIPEQLVGSNDNINVPVNYRYGIFGYSVGANYALNSKNAVFARVSQVEVLLQTEFYSQDTIIPIMMILHWML